AADRHDRAADPEAGRLDGIAFGERAVLGRRLGDPADGPLRADGTFRGAAEHAVALALRSRRLATAVRLVAPGGPHVLAQLCELGARRGELALGVRHRLGARPVARGADELELALEVRFATARRRQRALDLTALHGRVALGRLRLG